MLKIYYTGIGCNYNGYHTKKEFLDIMNKEFTHKIWKDELNHHKEHYQLQFKNWILPNDFILFNLQEWIEYSGAEIYIF